MKIDVKAVAATLNKIMEYELAGTVRYTHYSLMTYGYNRIPIVSWLRGQATHL
jgi:bacterioferritin